MTLKYQIKDSSYTLKPEQIRSLIDSLPLFRNRLIIKLLAHTGIRRGELIGIRLSDIDYDAQVIQVMGKGKKYRPIPVSRSILNDIKVWTGTRFLGYLFPSTIKKFDTPITFQQINRVCMSAGELAGIKNPNPKMCHINPHLFRHSFARIAKSRGMSFETLQNIMGHSSYVTTMDMYGTMSLDDIKKESECMAFI